MTKQDSTSLMDLKALEAVLKALEPLAEGDRERVLRWASEKLGIQQLRGGRAQKKTDAIDAAFEKHPAGFQSAGEFLAAASPSSDADRVLCVAAYLQDFSDDAHTVTLTGKQINDVLKNLGHGVKNITDSINTLNTDEEGGKGQTGMEGISGNAGGTGLCISTD
jgi:hypothetical protein